MAFRSVSVVDNRDAHEMFGYLEARVEIMRRRIKELERENETLRRVIGGDSDSILLDNRLDPDPPAVSRVALNR